MLKQCDVDTQAGAVIAPTITAEVHLNIGGANFNFTFSASTPMTLTHDRAHQMHTVLPHTRPLCNLAGPPSRVLLAGVGGAAQAACTTSSAVPNQTEPWGVTQLFPQDNDIWSSCPQVPASFNSRGAPVLPRLNYSTMAPGVARERFFSKIDEYSCASPKYH